MIRDAQKAIKIKARVCSLVNGVLPCKATATCYNTRFTCRDLKNIDETTQSIWFFEPSARLPAVPVGELIFPTLQGVSEKEAELNPGSRFQDVSALGKRAEITLTIGDHLHHDRGIDPYFAMRSKEPAGTFWSRWLARNQNYAGTLIELYDVVDGVFSLPEIYEIDSISTSSAGVVSIRALDVLRRAYESDAPEQSIGTLATDIDASQTSFAITTASSYSESGYIAIGSEVMKYTRDGLVMSVERGEGSNHKQGDLVQECLVFDEATVSSVLYDLLTKNAEIDPSYIDLADWIDAENTWMPAVRLSRVIAKPTKIKNLISEILEQTLALIWFDQTSQKIRYRPNQPGVSIKKLTDESNILDTGVTVNRDDDARYNVITVRFGKRDPLAADNSAESYARAIVSVASDEDFRRYDERVKQREIFANWLPENQAAQALILSSIALQESVDQLTTTTLDLEYKDSEIDLGDVVTVSTRDLVGFDGSPIDTTALVVMKREIEQGLRYRYRFMLSRYANIRFGVIAPDEWDFDLDAIGGDYDGDADSIDYDLDFLPPYDWAFYTDVDRDKYVFLSDGENNFSDGRPPYQLA